MPSGIIYNDISDTIISYNSATTGASQYSIDLNMDSVIDFNLAVSLSYDTINFPGLYIYSNQKVFLYATDTLNSVSIRTHVAPTELLQPLNLSAIVADTNRWSNFGCVCFSAYYWGGCATPNDFYTGLRIYKGGVFYYGWIRIEPINYSSCVLKAYAINTLPNQPILIGQIY